MLARSDNDGGSRPRMVAYGCIWLHDDKGTEPTTIKNDKVKERSRLIHRR